MAAVTPITRRARQLWGIRNRLTEAQFVDELVAIEQEAGQEIADGRMVEFAAAVELALETLPKVAVGAPGYSARSRLEKIAAGTWEFGK